MRPKLPGTIVTLIALMIASLLAGGVDRAAVAQGTYCASAAEAEMLRLINGFREENGLQPLALSQPLGVAANSRASDMAARDYVDHVSPEGLGFGGLLANAGYSYDTAVAENLAAGNQGAAATFEQWLTSSEHRANMLGGQYTAIGIGRADNPDATYGWYWAAAFGGVVGEPAAICGEASVDTTAIIDTIIAVILQILAGL